jgi:hypothetical protein
MSFRNRRRAQHATVRNREELGTKAFEMVEKHSREIVQLTDLILAKLPSSMLGEISKEQMDELYDQASTNSAVEPIQSLAQSKD